jgi:hypothetical protein
MPSVTGREGYIVGVSRLGIESGVIFTTGAGPCSDAAGSGAADDPG